VGDIVQTRKGCKSGIIWTRLSLLKPSWLSPKEDLVEGKVEHAPRLPKSINTTPYEPKERLPWRSNHSTDVIHQKTAAAR
jgi:hypothetical protein